MLYEPRKLYDELYAELQEYVICGETDLPAYEDLLDRLLELEEGWSEEED